MKPIWIDTDYDLLYVGKMFESRHAKQVFIIAVT